MTLGSARDSRAGFGVLAETNFVWYESRRTRVLKSMLIIAALFCATLINGYGVELIDREAGFACNVPAGCDPSTIRQADTRQCLDSKWLSS